jgi:hypothetical protein
VKIPNPPDQKDGLEAFLHFLDDDMNRGQGVNRVAHNGFGLDAPRLVSAMLRNRVENDDVINVFIDSAKLANVRTCCGGKHRLRLPSLMECLRGREQDEIHSALKEALALKAERQRVDGRLPVPDTEWCSCRGL